jgi:hypothetical protein
MPFDFGLLSNAALTGLSKEEQDSLQRQATSQFLLGSILGGDPSVGFKSAMSVPEQYTSAQKNILELRQKAADRQSIADFQNKYLPTQFNETSPEFRGPVTPDVESSQNELAAARSQGLPFNIQNALQDVIRLPTAAQGPMRETISSLQPKVQGDLLLNPNMEILRGLPTQKDQIQTKFNERTGLFEAKPVVNALGAKIATTLPEVPVGAQLQMNNAGVIEANLIPNMRTVQQQLAFDKQFGTGQANLQTTPTNVLQPATGRTVRTTEAQAMGLPTALSPSETLAFEGYKPVRDAAFKSYQAATSSDASLQNLQNIINRGAFEPGKFAAFKSEAAAIATGLGIGGDRAKAVAVDSPLFLQSVADVASANIQDLVGATSDKDIQFSASRGPQITNPKEAVQYYLDLTKVANQRKKDYYNYVTNNPVPNVVEKWSQTEKGSASIFEDPKLRKYLPQSRVGSGPDKGKIAYQLPSGIYRVYD